MLSGRFVVAFVALVACQKDADPGFEIVRVPAGAYATPDAGARGDAAVEERAADGGRQPLVLCIKPAPSDDDESSSDDCAPSYHGRAYDEHVTSRHRNKGESDVCCYRRGRLPHPAEADDGD